MSKNSKIAVIIAVAFLFGVVIFPLASGLLLFSGFFVDGAPLPVTQRVHKSDFNEYLCDKYGEELFSQFKLIDYHRAEKNIDYDFFEGYSTSYYGESACYEAKDRTFHVLYDSDKKDFFDDYQYEDIESYSVAYFSELFDTDVAGVIYDYSLFPNNGSVYPFSLIHFLSENNSLWTEDNFESMLVQFFRDYQNEVGIYVKSDFKEPLYDDYLLSVEWEKKLEERFSKLDKPPSLSVCLVNFDPVIERWSDYTDKSGNTYGYSITYYWLCNERYGYTPYFYYFAETDRLNNSSYAEAYHDDNPKSYALDYGGEAMVELSYYDIFQ